MAERCGAELVLSFERAQKLLDIGAQGRCGWYCSYYRHLQILRFELKPAKYHKAGGYVLSSSVEQPVNHHIWSTKIDFLGNLASHDICLPLKAEAFFKHGAVAGPSESRSEA